MSDFLQVLSSQLGTSVQTLSLAGIGLGTLVIVWGLFGAFADRNPASGRMVAPGRTAAASGGKTELVRRSASAPKGVMKTFIPGTNEERTRVQTQLMQAGITGENAVRNYYLLRVGLGIVLPLALLTLLVVRPYLPLPEILSNLIGGVERSLAFQVITVLVILGFYGPTIWLKRKVKARSVKIEQGFPNALDLMQVSVEAGLGFNSAVTQVGRELLSVSPEIAEEFLTMQREILAGRERDAAMLDMANRMGIDEAQSFVNVVLQSMQYGTSMATALNTYAIEMRQTRELKAQEKANKLPVQMSLVLSCFMLPALLMITIGPVVIRYIRYFEAN